MKYLDVIKGFLVLIFSYLDFLFFLEVVIIYKIEGIVNSF